MKGRAQDMGVCNEEDVGLTGPLETTWALPKPTPVRQPLLLCTHYVQTLFTFVVKTPEVTVRQDPESSHKHAGWWSALRGSSAGKGPGAWPACGLGEAAGEASRQKEILSDK